MPTPLAPRLALTPRLLALAALGLVSHCAHAQLPAPALPPSAKPPSVARPPASSPAPARSQQKPSALPAPALPAPAKSPAKAEDTAPEVVVEEGLPATAPEAPAAPQAPQAPQAAQTPAPSTQSDDGVTVLPQDTPEFSLPPRTAAKPAAKPKAPAARAKLVARVGGVDVASGTEAAALARLQKEHGNRLGQPVVLRLGGREFWTTRGELGATLPLPTLLRAARERARPSKPADVALRYEMDDAVALKYLQKLAPAVRREPQAIGDGQSGRAGEELSLGGSLARVRAAITGGGTQVELLPNAIPFVPKPLPAAPEIDALSGPASGDARFPIVLAEYSTRYNARLEDRTENLRIAAREINGTVVPAGGVFSANSAIGPRSTGRGFRAAHIFMGKKVIEGVGGGICQSATTVYNAALGARLTIVERHSHSLPVSYATPKNDATIYWGQKDMKFRNNTGGPILVRTFLKSGRFHAQILAPRPADPAPAA